MNKLMIAACAAAFSVTTMAQQAQPVPAKQVDKVQQGEATDEVHTASAELKEAYGYLSRELAMLGREIGPDGANATPEQVTLRDRMKSTLEGLEASLTAVNSLKGEEWKTAKVKADGIRAEAMSIVTTRRNAREGKK